jgi:hypothetical protein
MKLLDLEVAQVRTTETMNVGRSPNAFGRRVGFDRDPAAQLEGRGEPRGLRATDSPQTGNLGRRSRGQLPERPVGLGEEIRRDGKGVPTSAPRAQEDGQKLLAGKRGSAVEPEALSRPVVDGVFGEPE